MIHVRAMLANLRDGLHYMKQLANHVLEYVGATTSGILTPHLVPVTDLQNLLESIEKNLPPNMHLPVPSSDPLHFYRHLKCHVLIERNEFLLLIDIPIQDRAQQIQIYKIINIPVPVGNFSIQYEIPEQYLGVTYDHTKALVITPEQFSKCQSANGQFCPMTAPLQTLTNPPSCVAGLYIKSKPDIDRYCRIITRTQPKVYLPIALAANLWAIVTPPAIKKTQMSVMCPKEPVRTIEIKAPLEILRLQPACSATTQYFHLPPKYENAHIETNISLYNAQLDIVNISLDLFRITQHLPEGNTNKQLEKLSAFPSVPIMRITEELLGLTNKKTTMVSDTPFWMKPSFLAALASAVLLALSAAICLCKKRLKSQILPAKKWCLSFSKKRTDFTGMDDEYVPGITYRPCGTVDSAIRFIEETPARRQSRPIRKLEFCEPTAASTGMKDSTLGVTRLPETPLSPQNSHGLCKTSSSCATSRLSEPLFSEPRSLPSSVVQCNCECEDCSICTRDGSGDADGSHVLVANPGNESGEWRNKYKELRKTITDGY